MPMARRSAAATKNARARSGGAAAAAAAAEKPRRRSAAWAVAVIGAPLVACLLALRLGAARPGGGAAASFSAADAVDARRAAACVADWDACDASCGVVAVPDADARRLVRDALSGAAAAGGAARDVALVAAIAGDFGGGSGGGAVLARRGGATVLARGGGGGGGGGGGAAVADGALLALDAECPRGPRAWSGGSPRLAAVLRVAVPPPVNAAMLVELDLALRLEDPPIRANHRVVDADAERKPEPHHHHLGELWPSTISRIRVQCIDPSTQSERVLLHVWSAGPIFLRGRCVGRIVRAAHVVGQRDEDEHGQRRHRIYGDKILTPSRGSLKTLPARVVRTKRGCASQCV